MKKTHIPKLDDFLGGGIPEGSSVLFYADPGVECEAFGYQTLQSRLEEGDHGFIFTNVTEPNSILYEFEKFGWDLEKEMEVKVSYRSGGKEVSVTRTKNAD